jgi:hypothetical protein
LKMTAKTIIEATTTPAAMPTPAVSASEYGLEQWMLT